MKLKDKNIRVVKLKDIKFDGNHPNGIVEGTVRIGTALTNLEVDQSLWLSSGFVTTRITEINEKNNTFNTLNSVYKFEIID